MSVERRPFPWAVSRISESVTIADDTGRWVLLSGQAALLEDGSVLHGDMAAQTRLTLERVGAALAAVGASLDDVVKLTVYLADMDAFPAFSAVRDELVPAAPATTTVGVAALYGGALVEIEALAYRA